MRPLIVLVTLLLLGRGDRAAAGVESVAVKVDGLTCPFCAYGLEKHLKKVEGVRSVRIDVDGGEAVLTVAEEARLGPAGGRTAGLLRSVPDAVTKGGFTARALTVVAAGRVEAEADGVRLVLSGTGEEVRLEAGANSEPLRALSGGGPVRVRGTAHGDAAAPWLEVTQILPPQPAAESGEEASP